MKKYTRVTEKTFKAMKLMLAAGAPFKEVAEYMDVSTTTVSRVNMAQTYEEYQYESNKYYFAKKAAAEKAAKEEQARKDAEQAAAARAAAAAASVAPSAQQKPSAAGNYQVLKLFELIKEQNEILKGISNKMAYIVEDLYGKKEDS